MPTLMQYNNDCTIFMQMSVIADCGTEGGEVNCMIGGCIKYDVSCAIDSMHRDWDEVNSNVTSNPLVGMIQWLLMLFIHALPTPNKYMYGTSTIINLFRFF